MKVDVMATRMSVLTRALPLRILLVDDDELELELMAQRLATAGFEVKQAPNGAEALKVLEQQWYPLVITDWQMPVMDGLAFCEALRARGVEDTYIIMLTTREASTDYERGYASGVDDYLTKKVPDAELHIRIHAAFNTLMLRRSLKQAREALEESVSIDWDSGVFTPRETKSRLHAEICRAQRYGRQLSAITVGIGVLDESAPPIDVDSLRKVAQSLTGVVRAHVDWVGRLDAPQGAQFVVVLPEAGISNGPMIKERLAQALQRLAGELPFKISFGLVALERSEPGGGAVDVQAFLNVAERCRICSGRLGAPQLAAVKLSVANHVSIACRNGYVVDNECPLHSTEKKDS